MIPDCIDPEAGSLLHDIASKPVSAAEHHYQEIGEARLHWNGCPACRHAFPSMPDTIRQIGLEFERMIASDLSWMSEEFVRQKRSLLMATAGLDNAYVGIIVRLLEAYEEVQLGFTRGNYLTPALYGVDAEWPSDWSGEQSLLFHRAHRCTEFFRSLESDVQQFVAVVTLCFSMLRPILEKVRVALPPEEEQQRLHTAIAKSGLALSAFVVTLELAATAYCDSVRVPSTTPVLTDSSPKLLAPQDSALLQSIFEFKEELKQEFDNFQDSMKAGQMEIVRLYEHNKPRAVEYEPYIIEQLGASLYSRLHEQTQRALQMAEYFYTLNQEPDGFGETAKNFAMGYEIELRLRTVYPFVRDLEAAGTENYDADGRSKVPLLRDGQVSKNAMTLGGMVWWLRNDTSLRTKVSSLGLDAEAICRDAEVVRPIRNHLVHNYGCNRDAVDDLRRRMLRRDGMFSRLHPMAAIAPNAS